MTTPRRSSLQAAWSALTAFLSGFVGISRRDSGAETGPTSRCEPDAAPRPSAAAARAALAERAARRPNCC